LHRIDVELKHLHNEISFCPNFWLQYFICFCLRFYFSFNCYKLVLYNNLLYIYFRLTLHLKLNIVVWTILIYFDIIFSFWMGIFQFILYQWLIVRKVVHCYYKVSVLMRFWVLFCVFYISLFTCILMWFWVVILLLIWM
jgi:hypothetical protein